MIDEIIEYEDFIDGDSSSVSFAGVEFKDDFGPWKKGQKIDSLTLVFCQLGEEDTPGPTLQEWSYDGDMVRECKVRLAPVANPPGYWTRTRKTPGRAGYMTRAKVGGPHGARIGRLYVGLPMTWRAPQDPFYGYCGVVESFVDPAHQRQGVGSRLYEEAVRYCCEIGGRGLYSDGSTRTPESDALWESLHRRGIARRGKGFDGLDYWIPCPGQVDKNPPKAKSALARVRKAVGRGRACYPAAEVVYHAGGGSRAGMTELSSAQRRVLEAFPPGSRCWTCGGPNSAHRIMDEIRGRHEAGDSAERLAKEFGRPKIAINCLLRMPKKDYEAMLLASALPEHEN